MVSAFLYRISKLFSIEKSGIAKEWIAKGTTITKEKSFIHDPAFKLFNGNKAPHLKVKSYCIKNQLLLISKKIICNKTNLARETVSSVKILLLSIF